MPITQLEGGVCVLQPNVSCHLAEMPNDRAADHFRLSEKRIDDVYDSRASANNVAGRETDSVFPTN